MRMRLKSVNWKVVGQRCLLTVGVLPFVMLVGWALVGLIQEKSQQILEAKTMALVCSEMQDGSCVIAFPRDVSNRMNVLEMKERILQRAHQFFGKDAILGAVPATLEGASGYAMRVYLKNEEGAAEALGNH